jgi:hypothetical protein
MHATARTPRVMTYDELKRCKAFMDAGRPSWFWLRSRVWRIRWQARWWVFYLRWAAGFRDFFPVAWAFHVCHLDSRQRDALRRNGLL